MCVLLCVVYSKSTGLHFDRKQAPLHPHLLLRGRVVVVVSSSLSTEHSCCVKNAGWSVDGKEEGQLLVKGPCHQWLVFRGGAVYPSGTYLREMSLQSLEEVVVLVVVGGWESCSCAIY